MPLGSPSRLAWQRLRRRRSALLGMAIVLLEVATVLVAPQLIS
ncbi:MAG: hypothetical protein ACREQL_06735, partial [Candidatus Binatia bacterium]